MGGGGGVCEVGEAESVVVMFGTWGCKVSDREDWKDRHPACRESVSGSTSSTMYIPTIERIRATLVGHRRRRRRGVLDHFGHVACLHKRLRNRTAPLFLSPSHSSTLLISSRPLSLSEHHAGFPRQLVTQAGESHRAFPTAGTPHSALTAHAEVGPPNLRVVRNPNVDILARRHPLALVQSEQRPPVDDTRLPRFAVYKDARPEAGSRGLLLRDLRPDGSGEDLEEARAHLHRRREAGADGLAFCYRVGGAGGHAAFDRVLDAWLLDSVHYH